MVASLARTLHHRSRNSAPAHLPESCPGSPERALDRKRTTSRCVPHPLFRATAKPGDVRAKPPAGFAAGDAARPPALRVAPVERASRDMPTSTGRVLRCSSVLRSTDLPDDKRTPQPASDQQSPPWPVMMPSITRRPSGKAERRRALGP